MKYFSAFLILLMLYSACKNNSEEIIVRECLIIIQERLIRSDVLTLISAENPEGYKVNTLLDLHIKIDSTKWELNDIYAIYPSFFYNDEFVNLSSNDTCLPHKIEYDTKNEQIYKVHIDRLVWDKGLFEK